MCFNKEHQPNDDVFDEDFDDTDNQDQQAIVDAGALLKPFN